jgi:hypothetical protein
MSSKRKKTKCIKSLIGIGTIGVIGLGVSASITSCEKTTTTDVVSFNNDYQPSMSSGHEQTFHASSSIDDHISYEAKGLPTSGVTFDSSTGKLHYMLALPTNQDITIKATSDKGGHSAIKITILADTPVPPTPTPALSASISADNLQFDTTNTATLSVTEINTTS